MNPAMLGQAANMNPASNVASHLDAAVQLLNQAVESAPADSREADVAIEEYMAALLARSRNPKDDHGRPASVPDARARAAAHNARQDPAPETARRERKPMPAEGRDAISELRELANINARSTFNVHQSRQLVYELNNKLAVALVSLVVSFALTSLAENTRSLNFFAAIVALLVAVHWSTRYFQLARQLRTICFPRRDDLVAWQPEPTAAEEQLAERE
jgi:hypothetical protein